MIAALPFTSPGLIAVGLPSAPASTLLPAFDVTTSPGLTTLAAGTLGAAGALGVFGTLGPFTKFNRPLPAAPRSLKGALTTAINALNAPPKALNGNKAMPLNTPRTPPSGPANVKKVAPIAATPNHAPVVKLPSSPRKPTSLPN